GTTSQIDTRLNKLDRAQQGLINSVEENTDRRIRELKSIIAMTDVVDAKTMLKRGTSSDTKKQSIAEGGPFLGLTEGEALAGAGEESTFAKQFFRVSQNLNTMADLEK